MPSALSLHLDALVCAGFVFDLRPDTPDDDTSAGGIGYLLQARRNKRLSALFQLRMSRTIFHQRSLFYHLRLLFDRFQRQLNFALQLRHLGAQCRQFGFLAPRSLHHVLQGGNIFGQFLVLLLEVLQNCFDGRKGVQEVERSQTRICCRSAACRHIRQGCRAARQAGAAQRRIAARRTDARFGIPEFVKPRNWGFNTVGGDASEEERNGIRASIYRTVTITDGGQVSLRLSEAMTAGGVLIPAGTVVAGAARIAGDRLGITINAVQHAGTVIPIELLVYDMDGNEGISVPGSEEINAVKEIAANMGSGIGSSITITDDAGSQLFSDLGRSAIQGVSSYVSKKMRTVKVTLKADYAVLLLPPQK